MTATRFSGGREPSATRLRKGVHRALSRRATKNASLVPTPVSIVNPLMNVSCVTKLVRDPICKMEFVSPSAIVVQHRCSRAMEVSVKLACTHVALVTLAIRRSVSRAQAVNCLLFSLVNARKSVLQAQFKMTNCSDVTAVLKAAKSAMTTTSPSVSFAVRA